MKLKDFIKHHLEVRYLGKRIKCQYSDEYFTVYQVTVEDRGVDPQWEFLLTSKKCLDMMDESVKWQAQNNTLGGISTPPELTKRWYEGYKEYYRMNYADDDMPEIKD